VLHFELVGVVMEDTRLFVRQPIPVENPITDAY
jgi:hypothetical protein